MMEGTIFAFEIIVIKILRQIARNTGHVVEKWSRWRALALINLFVEGSVA